MTLKLSGLSYEDWLNILIQHKRANCPELSDENPYEPAIQILRAFALVGYYSSQLLNLIARQCFLPTADFYDAIQRHAELLGYRLTLDIPATATLIARLTKHFVSEQVVVPSGSAFSTETCLLYTSPSPRDLSTSRMPSSA